MGTKMATPKRSAADEISKFQRYRQSQRKRGMKLLRVWVPDPRRPEFAQEAARQAEILRKRPEEREAMAFIEAAFPWPDP